MRELLISSYYVISIWYSAQGFYVSEKELPLSACSENKTGLCVCRMVQCFRQYRLC